MRASSIPLHDPLPSRSRAAPPIHELLALPIPDMSHPHDQCQYMFRMHNSLVAMLSGAEDIRDNPFFYDDAAAGEAKGHLDLKNFRANLGTLILDHAEGLSSSEDNHRAPGYNRLLLYWIVHCLASVVLDVLSPCHLQAFPEPSNILARNELLCTGGGLVDVPLFSLWELRKGVDLLRDRLWMIDDCDPTLVRYILLLEVRASHFVVGTVAGAADWDLPLWMTHAGDRPVASKVCLVSLAWAFVWIKRHVAWFRLVGDPRFYSSEVLRGRVCDVRGVDSLGRYREGVLEFIRTVASSMKTDDHKNQFSKIAVHYNVAPGDIDAHSQLYGIGGIERAHVREVVGRRKTPTAATYVANRKYQRELLAWVTSFTLRNHLAGVGRFVGGGASCEAFFEQLALIHIANSFFVGKLRVELVKKYIIVHRAAGADYIEKINKAKCLGTPFILQRLGRFACCVPAIRGVPQASEADYVDMKYRKKTHSRIEREYFEDMELDDSRSDEDEEHCVLYDCRDFVDALAVWAIFMLEGWGGVESISNKKMGPVLKNMLGKKENEEAPVVENGNVIHAM